MTAPLMAAMGKQQQQQSRLACSRVCHGQLPRGSALSLRPRSCELGRGPAARRCAVYVKDVLRHESGMPSSMSGGSSQQ